MNRGLVNLRLPRLTADGLVILVIVLSATFIAAVLIPGLELAGELVESSSALKFVSEQQGFPTSIRESLDAMHDHLAARGDIQDSARTLRASVEKLEVALPAMNAPRPANWFALAGDTSAMAESISGKHETALRALWAREHDALASLLSYAGVPYVVSVANGAELSESGRQLEQSIAAATLMSRDALPPLDTELAALSADIRKTTSQAATQLRLVLLGGLIFAGTLVVLIVVMVNIRRRQEEGLKQARQQTADILRTVKDGLFLLDQELIIGTAYSSALETLFQRTDIAGTSFESFLKNIVSEKTLSTATKYVSILWSERTKEKLVKSINPLGEVEVHLDAGQGRFETRFLQFEFHRVRVHGRITQLLVSVSDVTSRVELARELQASQGQAQAQVDTLIGILHIDPIQLASFLSDSSAAMKMINAVLREPAREETVFRKKIDSLFRLAHSVKGEAAALGLSSIESRAHSFEDDLKTLREKPDLSGNDFLPLVIKLDDLLTHLQSVGDLVSRMSRLHTVARDLPHVATAVNVQSSGAPVPSDFGLGASLQQLAARIASENNKQAAVRCTGFDLVPEEYRRIVKDIAIQAVRNSIVHGIELPSARLAVGKLEQGQVRLTFQGLGNAGYKLSIEDDGQGLAMDRIKEVAIKKKLLTTEQAASLDAKGTYSLLFKPGFSTIEQTTKDAGRGVGMNLIAGLMQQVGGRVGVATVAGQFMRLTVSMPLSAKGAEDTVAA